MKFENQLHQLIEQHKNLHSVFVSLSYTVEVIHWGLISLEHLL